MQIRKGEGGGGEKRRGMLEKRKEIWEKGEGGGGGRRRRGQESKKARGSEATKYTICGGPSG